MRFAIPTDADPYIMACIADAIRDGDSEEFVRVAAIHYGCDESRVKFNVLEFGEGEDKRTVWEANRL